ncbi:MAG: lamin tail domain-containing protein, partial [Bacteroidaceae bacterium]|nr:lamin tail domain-containing protein [Bacteroidaceae bacterium]
MKNYIISLLLLLFPAFVAAQETEVPPLTINEIQVANIDQYLDNAFCYGSWIEFYNPSSESVALKGLYLSDGVNEYHFTSLALWGSVAPGGFKVLYFGHSQSEGNYGASSKAQMPFKLEPEGGTISLLNTDKSVISSVDYPPSISRCSWARTQDGGEEWEYTGEPTPEASNNNSDFAEFRLDAPKVSVDSKVFTENFWVQVQIPAGCTLRYTLDGSAPTATNGETSTYGFFQITSTTILRLCLFSPGMLPSPVVTRSYIYKNHDYYLPILSIVSEDKNFFDSQIGVFVRGSNGVSGNGQSSPCNWNMDWERPVNMEYLVPAVRPQPSDEMGTTADECTAYDMVLNQEMDLEISGGWTRAYGGGTVDDRYWEARSSFRIKTDKRYEGVNAIDYPIFPSKPHNKYRCWQVRNGGNDTYARSKDPSIQMMVLKSGFQVNCQDYQPAHVFLNGMYYGMLNIRESNNKHYAYSNYGINFDDMDQFDLSNAQYNQKMGDNKAWMQLQRWATTLARTKSEEIYNQICGLLDIDEYINYMALECYMGPTDWITNTNNVKGFRSRTDGKFHFVLFDCESAFGTSNMLSDVLSTGGGANVDDLFRNLMKYDPFRRQFMDAYCIVDGSVFEPSRCEQIVREIYYNTTPALQFEGSSAGMGMIGSVRSAHNGSRITNMRNYYGLTYGLFANIASNIPEARLSVNGQEFPTGKFDGYLFSYNDMPIQLTAKAPAGYTFKGWESESAEAITTTLIPEGSQWMYYDNGPMDNFDWKALSFDESANGWQEGTAPFGFGREGYYMQESSATKLNRGPNNNRPTYYFRKTFQLDAPLADDDFLTFYYQIDDGMMLYVNGHEVGGYYIASGSPYNTYTVDGHYESQDPYYGSFNIPHEYLLVGENQIAVEAKNCSSGSTDMWFEASLTYTRKDRQLVSESESFDLHETFDKDSYLLLKAKFAPITGEQERWAAGASPLRINEVNAVGDICINDYGKKEDWLELYNTTDQDISLEGLYLSDNSRNPQKYKLQEGVVPAHGTCVIWCDKKEGINQIHAPFKLENADGAKVSIQAADGSWADQLEYMEHDKYQTF